MSDDTNNTAGHTPGQWHRNIKPAWQYPIIFAGRNTHVARVLTTGLPEDEVEANCDLIADAPRLKAENERLRGALEALQEAAITRDNGGAAIPMEIFTQVDAALTGEGE